MIGSKCITSLAANAAFVLFVESFFLAPSLAGADSRVDRICADWSKRRNRTEAVEYRVEGNRMVPKGSLSLEPEFEGMIIPASDHTSKLTLYYLMDFRKNWFRKEEESRIYNLHEKEFVPRYQLTVCDGNDIEVFQPRDKDFAPAGVFHTDLWVRVESASASILLGDLPVFVAHGIIPSKAIPSPKSLMTPVNANDFAFERHGNIGGRACAVLRTSNGEEVYEYWVDESRQSTIRRIELSIEGVLQGRVEIEYANDASNLLPIGWRVDSFDSPGVILVSDRLAVQKANVNPALSKDLFQIEKTSGMIVGDLRSQKTYIVGTDGSLKEITSSREQSPYLLVGVLAAIILAALFGFRKRIMVSVLSLKQRFYGRSD